MNPKVLVVVLVLLVVLFFVGVSLGIASGEAEVPDCPAGWVESLGRRLGGKQPLSPQDVVQANCPSGWPQLLQGEGTLALSGGLGANRCVLVVKESSVPVRTLALGLSSGSANTLIRYVMQGEQELELEQTLSAGGDKDQIELQFLRSGGVLEIVCPGPSCVLVTPDQSAGPCGPP